MLHNGPYNQQSDLNGSYNAQSLEQLANEVLDSRYVNDGDYTVPQPNGDSVLHPALQQQGSVSSQNAGYKEDISPLLAKAHPSLHLTNGVDHTSHLIDANGIEHRPISSGGPVQPHNTDSSGFQLQNGVSAITKTSDADAPLHNGHGQPSLAAVQPGPDAVTPPLGAPLTQAQDVTSSAKESAISLAAAPITDSSN